MSQGLLLKKKEQHLQHTLMLQQQQMNQLQHHSFPSPITPSYDKKALASPSSSSSSSCRFDALNGSSVTAAAAEVTSSASLYSSPTSSSSASTPSSAHSTSSQRHGSYGQYHFGEGIYGSGGNFLSSSYASAAALGSHHDLTRSSCSALPSPTIYPPTPPPSSTPWLHHAWFGSMEAAGYMKTPKNNPFDN